MSKTFEAIRLSSRACLGFTEETAPAWLTGENTVPGSTMDSRWFWKNHILTLGIGDSIRTDFHVIRRIR